MTFPISLPRPILACALGLALAIPQISYSQDSSADTVLATVNGTEIKLGHIIALVERLPENYQTAPDDSYCLAFLNK